MTNIILGSEAAKHLYEVGTVIDGQTTRIEVMANTAAQAGSIAKKNGYTVRDMNMVG
jgi:hypothetical protein